jgi:beta-glucanase (GH16 family)
MLDAAKWVATRSRAEWRNVDNPAGNPHGDSKIEAQTYDPSRVALVPGVGLRLSAGPAPVGGVKPYTSASVQSAEPQDGKTLFAQRFGRFEASIRMPRQNGLWPAFWLLPADGMWPPEIDVVEFIAFPNGATPTNATKAPWIGMNPATTLHWKTTEGLFKQATAGIDYSIDRTDVWPPFTDTFHTYAVEWRPERLSFFLDGEPVFCSSEPAAIPQKAMYLILNLAISNGTRDRPGWAGYVPTDAKWPQSMDVAFVKVWQFKDLQAAAAQTTVAPAQAPSAPSHVGKPKSSHEQ